MALLLLAVVLPWATVSGPGGPGSVGSGGHGGVPLAVLAVTAGAGVVLRSRALTLVAGLLALGFLLVVALSLPGDLVNEDLIDAAELSSGIYVGGVGALLCVGSAT